MQKVMLFINNIIRAQSEIMYYKKNKESKKIEYLRYKVQKDLNDILEISIKESDCLLEKYIRETIDKFTMKKTDIINDIYGVKDYILNKYDIDLCFFCENNLSIIKKRNKKLYEQVIDMNVQNNRKYNISWNRLYDISLSIEMSEKERINICSFGDPWREALLYAKNINKNADVCIIFGFGVGYHIQEMSALYPEKSIYILENDIEQIRAAVYYRDISDILENKNIHLIYCRKTEEYAWWIKNIYNKEKNSQIECQMWMPAIKAIEDKRLRELLEEYRVTFFSMDYFKDILEKNFVTNIQLNDENVDAIKRDIYGKDAVLIAAGPSLDNELENLRKILKYENRENIVVLCVGKISRRLIEIGIEPDYIIMIDAKESTRWQISGIEESGVPLIYLATVASTVVKEYRSKRYIAYQKGFAMSENEAKKRGTTLFETGGSVATFAIDLSIRFKCKRLICLGLDMGYVSEKTHAGEVGSKISDVSMLKEVEAVGGGMIYTNKSLNIYRKWIERRILGEKNVEIINASNGAKIHGMKEEKLQDIYNLMGKK